MTRQVRTRPDHVDGDGRGGAAGSHRAGAGPTYAPRTEPKPGGGADRGTGTEFLAAEAEPDRAAADPVASATARAESAGLDVARAKAAVAGGAPLPEAERARWEQLFGVDLASVRVNTGGDAAAQADGMGAAAYNVGEGIGFAAGAHQPGTPQGDALMAHELAHVIQQRGGGGGAPGVGAPGGAHEQEADRVAAAAQAAHTTTPQADTASREELKARLPDRARISESARTLGQAAPGFEIEARAETEHINRCIPGCTPSKSGPPTGPAWKAGAHVTPTFSVTEKEGARSNTAPATTDVDDPTFTGNAAIDAGASVWRYQIASAAGTGTIELVYYTSDHYPAPTPNDDSGALSNVTSGNWKDIVKDLKDNRDQIPSHWTSYRRTQLHERYHWQTEWQGEAKKEIAKAETEIEKLSVSFADAPDQATAETKLLPQVNKVWKDAIKRARTAYMALSDAPGSAPYKAGAAGSDALRTRVETHAASKGWT